MPFVAGAVMTAFEGGTITGTTEINTGLDAVSLSIESVNVNESTFTITGAAGWIPIEASSWEDAGTVALGGGGTGTASINATDTSGDVIVRSANSQEAVQIAGDATGDKVSVTAANAVAFRVSNGGYMVVQLNSAPADGVLSAGQAAVWFDSTNGAAKLMIKAKQADGTVKTGSVNVTT